MATYIIDGSDLTDVANAIRARGGTSNTLGFPDEFVDAIEDIPHDEPPSGSITITRNGTYDVERVASAVVNIPSSPSGTISINENGTYDVGRYADAEVAVPIFEPSGQINITENHTTYNVYDKAEAVVNVPGVVPTGTKNISVIQNGITTETVSGFENARITANVSIGDFSDYAYVDVQTSDQTLLTATNPFTVVPKLVVIEALSTPTNGKLIEGILTPNYGVVVRTIPVSSSWYAWSPTSTIGSSYRTYVYDISGISIRSYNSSSITWDTAVTYRVRFYK